MFKTIISTVFFAMILRGGVLAATTDTLSIEYYLETNKIEAQKTKEGIHIALQTEGNGANPRNGDYVKLRYTGKLLNGKVFDASPEGEPFVFQVGYRQVVMGWDLAMTRLKVGTKATIFVPALLAYGSSGVGESIPPDAPLMYEVEILSIMTTADYDAYMRELENKERQFFEQKMAKQFEEDKKAIQKYIVENNLKGAQRTTSGVSYVITKQGKGALPKKNNEITLHYEGTLLNGNAFDNTKDKKPFVFTLGAGKVIAGLEEGLSMFPKGSEGYLLIPSKLGYGATPIQDEKVDIPAHSVLVFKVQVVDIK